MILASGNAGLPTSEETGWPRVPQRVYEGVFITYLPVIVFATLVRLGLKIRNHRRLEVDDGFLVLALCCSLAAWAFVWLMRDLIYLQMEIVLGMKEIGLEDLRSMLLYFKWYNTSMVLTWAAIYSVKLSFMFFFRKLVSRVRSLEIYWWFILSILIPSAVFSAFFSFWICTDFSMTYLSNCPVSSMMYREEIYLYTTTALDIFTDLLIVSLPIVLLSKVSITLKRKIFLAMALCLSIFMIVICIIRATTCKLPNGIIDSTWLGLWQCIETNTAILMVSLTAFRSLFRQGSSTGYPTPVKVKKPPSWPSINAFGLSTKSQRSQENEPENYCVLPKRPLPAVSFTKRVTTEKGINDQLMQSLDPISDTSRESTMTSEREMSVNNPYLWSTRMSLGILKTENQIDRLDESRGEV